MGSGVLTLIPRRGIERQSWRRACPAVPPVFYTTLTLTSRRTSMYRVGDSFSRRIRYVNKAAPTPVRTGAALGRLPDRLRSFRRRHAITGCHRVKTVPSCDFDSHGLRPVFRLTDLSFPFARPQRYSLSSHFRLDTRKMMMFRKITLVLGLAAAIVTVLPASVSTSFAQLCIYWAQCW